MNQTILFLLFLVGSLLICESSAANGNCTELTNCQKCTATDNCGWCAAIQKCQEGNTQGPYNATCIGSNWEFTSCISCPQFTDCRECMARNTDCFWCNTPGIEGCKQQGFTCGDRADHCPCAGLEVCSDCLATTDCLWCSESTNCIEANETCVGPQPVYNYTAGCPCSANTDCANCNLDGCEWCQDENGVGKCMENCPGIVITNCQFYCSNVSTTCDSCVGVHGCAWCEDTRQCVDTSTSICPYATSCPVCSAATFCDTCNSLPGCGWCDDTVSCEATTEACFFAHDCNIYCDNFAESCDACNAVVGCGWCDGTKQCQSVASSNCLMTHSCPSGPVVISPIHKSFSGGSFVGGMFFMIGIFVILAAIYLIYRWKTGRKFDYRELK